MPPAFPLGKPVMIYVSVGSEDGMDWPQWAEHFISAYMNWAEISNKNELEFSAINRFLDEKDVPLKEFKTVVTTTYTAEGLKSTETLFVFGWDQEAEHLLFLSEFGRD